ncbi:uncharacterized protein BKCO1_1900064 [Diplodia corticola]|uniref:Uncharacterized protein n=1 Tax=Diplodia corticola TaxID=236234 RepID=A0A1J9S318_9PEZI|nr:uncharacterized protein BKCO1_1900064 [Diplodia corticola]OJD34951.1 hypothetical protein BKCO1_1900064 [Diplodia corticola]
MAEEEQQQPEVIGASETKEAVAGEEDDFRSVVRPGQHAMLPLNFGQGDLVYYVPDPRRPRARQGPYKVLKGRSGGRGHPPLYTLEGYGREVSEANLAY